MRIKQVKDLFERKIYFGARCTLRDHRSAWFPLLSVCRFVEFNTSIICYVLVHCFGLFLLQDMFRGGSRKFRKKGPSPPPSPSPQMKTSLLRTCSHSKRHILSPQKQRNIIRGFGEGPSGPRPPFFSCSFFFFLVSYINSSFLAKFRFPVREYSRRRNTVENIYIHKVIGPWDRVIFVWETEAIIRKVPLVRSPKQVIVLIFIFL